MSRSFLSRVPKLSRQLGPVTSTSYRLASRISNSLRAGTPVRAFADMDNAGFVVLCYPGGALAPLVQLDALDWSCKIVLLCDTPDHPALDLELRNRGASVASINAVSGLENRYVIVGDRAAVRFARTVAGSLRGHAVEISREQLLLFQSAVTLSGSFFTPLLETAAECLRQSGVDQKEAAELVESLFHHSLRTFKHAGRKSWSGPIALADDGSIAAQSRALETKNPMMADYFRFAGRFSFELYQTFPELTRYNKNRWRQFRRHYYPS